MTISQLRPKAFLFFALRLLLFGVILDAPWPGWHQGWARYLQATATATLAPSDGPAEVTFEQWPDSKSSPGIRVTIVNRNLMNRDGSGPVRNFGFKVDSLEVAPVALFIALTLATPMPLRRRAWQIPLGVFVLQAAILAFIAFCIWSESMEILLVPSSAGLKSVLLPIRQGITTYMGLTIPLFLWLSFNFRPSRSPQLLAPLHSASSKGSGSLCHS